MPRHFKVTVNGREYEVSVLELGTGQTQSVAAAAPVAGTLATAANTTTSAAVPAAAPAAAAPAGANDVVAAMGGVVVEVNVKVGQTVAAGDQLLVLEAMKMKTPITSARAGQVTKVLVAAGDAVDGGQPLVTIA
ncbi:MAG: biotin/lipoyl-containing protein [Candidatus Accumulibacter sp.]|uniref:acetyl-CoA carboxylase biotin carboxyl carrier protein subunit n=1 Tax=Accumulibacter sp. TaxID=2053492 RepID=UPI0028781EAE|nr:biotin/lipoyl-containing protein [Accumulibacter sp.]MDS4013536.1 biotin/lipoyl-containing protein [Accumulibacter sp.]